MGTTYYAYFRDNIPTRVVKIIDSIHPYAWIGGKWVERNSLIKILYDVGDDAVEISEEDANKYINAYTYDK